MDTHEEYKFQSIQHIDGISMFIAKIPNIFSDELQNDSIVFMLKSMQ